MSMGFLMFIHMLGTKHFEHHNPDECQICQQSLISSHKAIIESEIIIITNELFLHKVQFYTQHPKTRTKFLLPLLRAPPF